ncbi:DUF397 domain-containing protein [Streptomyces albus]|uniref:DUF397 domain-containing protein n=2 Tax=Streptomyces TaxID=1883 RepID=A0A8H1LG89_9ACTN|nr:MULTISPECIES: DUF397 domain-containing protein [Streptomyces]TGG84722.1 DUF397 domain-containing protein [Streptomyces albus]UVN56216.1 DUF397 domain-containing protein [Streptomyces albus]
MTNEQKAAPMQELSWRKSSYSGSDGGDCVEVAQASEVIYVRDSKEQRGPILSVPSREWGAFVRHVAGEG